MSNRKTFDDKYWNLSQAAAWVEFRERDLVEQFSAADRDDYVALRMYPTMWPAGRRRHGSIQELERALLEERLRSWGYRTKEPDFLTEIPGAEWADLTIHPPFAYDARQLSAQRQLWFDIRVCSADMKRLWRSELEVSGRSKFDWAAIKKIYVELNSQSPDISQNELMIEIQGTYRDRFNKEPPSRSSIQNKIKTWT